MLANASFLATAYITTLVYLCFSSLRYTYFQL